MHGDTVDDPYRWLESSDDEAVQEWVNAQNEYSETQLERMAPREALRPRMENLASTVEYEPVAPTRERFFQRVGGNRRD